MVPCARRCGACSSDLRLVVVRNPVLLLQECGEATFKRPVRLLAERSRPFRARPALELPGSFSDGLPT